MLRKTMKQIVSVPGMKLFIIALLLVVYSVAPALSAGPAISSFLPTKGSPGDNIIINGKGFVFANVSSNKVSFNGKLAKVAVMPTESQLVVTVPDTITGVITVENSNGPKATSDNVFEVIPTGKQIASSGTAPGRGDRKILNTYISGFKMADFANSTEYYAPPGSILWVDSIVNDKGNLLVHFAENWTNTHVGTELNDTKYKELCKGGVVSPGIKYTINAIELQNTSAQSQGFDYGLLVVPFKFHMSDHSLSGEATLGGYGGYQYSWPGVAVSLVASAGVGVVNITKQVDGVSKESNAASFSAAGGLVISLTKSDMFQIGLLVGLDWAGKGNQYKYERDPWVSVSFGTNFTK